MSLDAAISVGSVALGVADLDAQTEFYKKIIGLEVQHRSAKTIVLGVSGRPLIRLESRPGGARHPRSPGLFHLAILLPSRSDLGRWFQHLIDAGYPLEGAGDHLVSEALYLRDPEGNGIEIYRDRPRETWKYDGNRIKMATLPVDYQSLLAEAPDDEFEKMPEGTIMGHVHLQVDALEPNLTFYRDGMEFDVTALWPGAGFLGAGGYHHHIGINTWQSKGAAHAPEGSLGLLYFDLILTSTTKRDRVLQQLDSLQVPVRQKERYPIVQDPAGNSIRLLAT